MSKNAEVNEDLLEELHIHDPFAEVDADGNVTVYHRTTKENAESIRKTGIMTAKEDALFFSSKENGYASEYGDTIVKLKIPSTVLEVNDIFDGEVHFDVPLKRIGGKWQMNVSKYLDEKMIYKNDGNIRFDLSDELKFNPEGKSREELLESIFDASISFQSKYLYFGRFDVNFVDIVKKGGMVVNDLPILMNYRDAHIAMQSKEKGKYKGENINYHKIGIKGMDAAMDNIGNPEMVLRSRKRGRIELVLSFVDYKKDRGLAIIALNDVARNYDSYLEAHIVASVYGRRRIDRYIKNAEESGMVIYKKTEEPSQVKSTVQYHGVVNDSPSKSSIPQPAEKVKGVTKKSGDRMDLSDADFEEAVKRGKASEADISVRNPASCRRPLPSRELL